MLCSRHGFILAQIGLAKEYLSVQVGGTHLVAIHNAQAPHSGCCQVADSRTPQTARSNYENTGLLQSVLSFLTHFGQYLLTLKSVHSFFCFGHPPEKGGSRAISSPAASGWRPWLTTCSLTASV